MFHDVKTPLVSILSPCYNGENYISRMLTSILNQTYSNIEMICIDDGSTDNTKDIIFSFMDLFKNKGMTLKYFYQENRGQAAAINTGLKFITGEYLSWIDCDDFLSNDSVEKKVTFLFEHPDYAIVTSDFFTVDENAINVPIKRIGAKYGNLNFQTNQFYLTLVGSAILECHCHMINVSYFKKSNPKMEIDECREGQNYQMLLPILYRYKRGYIDEPLAYYVIRQNSHYHSQRTDEEWYLRYNRLNEMLRNTFKQMNISDKEIERYIDMSVFTREQRRLGICLK